jgi:type II secretory pathway component PulL
MQNREVSDPVSLIIKDCHQSENEANRIFHQLAEERQHYFTLQNGKRVHLSDQQLEEFAARFSSEVEPTYWESKRLKH